MNIMKQINKHLNIGIENSVLTLKNSTWRQQHKIHSVVVSKAKKVNFLGNVDKKSSVI